MLATRSLDILAGIPEKAVCMPVATAPGHTAKEARAGLLYLCGQILGEADNRKPGDAIRREP